MNKEQAIRVIGEATGMLRLTRKEHQMLEQALMYLKMYEGPPKTPEVAASLAPKEPVALPKDH